jgi:hypothetical protein
MASWLLGVSVGFSLLKVMWEVVRDFFGIGSPLKGALYLVLPSDLMAVGNY